MGRRGRRRRRRGVAAVAVWPSLNTTNQIPSSSRVASVTVGMGMGREGDGPIDGCRAAHTAGTRFCC